MYLYVDGLLTRVFNDDIYVIYDICDKKMVQKGNKCHGFCIFLCQNKVRQGHGTADIPSDPTYLFRCLFPLRKPWVLKVLGLGKPGLNKAQLIFACLMPYMQRSPQSLNIFRKKNRQNDKFLKSLPSLRKLLPPFWADENFPDVEKKLKKDLDKPIIFCKLVIF